MGEKSSEESKGEKETEKEQKNSGAPCTLPPVNDREAILYPWSVWSEINLPVQKKSGRKITHCGNCKDCDIIFEPLQVTFIWRKKCDTPVYPNVVKPFNIVSKMDEQEIYCHLYDLPAIPRKTQEHKNTVFKLVTADLWLKTLYVYFRKKAIHWLCVSLFLLVK